MALREKSPNTGFFSGPDLPVFKLNTGNYVLEKTPYLDTFQTVWISNNSANIHEGCQDRVCD